MKMNNNERIELIVNEEKNILNEVKENLVNKKDTVISNFQSIKNALTNMENSKNQIILINKIEDVVSEILSKIANATTIEELVSLRNDLNKEIRKVRNVLSKIEGFDMTHNEEIIKNTRNIISKLIRVKKRDEKVNFIKELMAKDELSDEEKSLLSKKIKNEKSFIKRNKAVDNEVKSILIDTSKNVINPITSNTTNDIKVKGNGLEGVRQLLLDLDEKERMEKQSNADSCNNSDIKVSPKLLLDLDEERRKEEQDIIDLCNHYDVKEAPMYDQGFIQNITLFFRNIRLFKHNRNSLYVANYDYDYYSRIKGTKMIIDYLKEVTTVKSIMNRLLFHKHTKLTNKYDETFKKNVSYIRDLLKNNVFDNNKEVEDKSLTLSLAK